MRRRKSKRVVPCSSCLAKAAQKAGAPSCAQARVLAPLHQRPWRRRQRGRPSSPLPKTSFNQPQPLRKSVGAQELGARPFSHKKSAEPQ